MPQQILAIDDSQDIHTLLAARLKPEGIDLYQALDAEEGMRKAIELQPDLILLDLDLPETSGFEVCARLKADPRTSALQIIFLTGTTEVTSKVRGFDLGAIDYVTKPFNASELRARVRAALRTKRFQDLLSERAQIDGLTGAFNRAYFDRRLAEEVARTRRYGSAFTLIMTDLDHFKQINDRCGHPGGDRALQAFAEAMLSSVRTTDAVCRYGGDEFALLLPETRAEAARVLTERVKSALELVDIAPRGEILRVTASWGLAEAPFAAPAPLTCESILERADAALYAAKHAGRNCAKIWTP